MKEDRLQHDLIMWFGQTWPEYNDMLFEVNNNPKNQIHGAYRKSMGMKKNVSDLILIIPMFATVAGIEVKAPGSDWPRSKIVNQLNWGKQVIKNNGFYIMCSDLALIRKFVTYLINGDIKRAKEIQSIALFFVDDQLKNKTIKF